MEVTSDDISSIINDLQNISKSNNVTVKLLTSEKEKTVRPLSVGQQKELLYVTSQDGILPQFDTNALSKIIIENIKDGGDVSVIDRDYIILQLKRQTTGETVTLYVGDEEMEFNLGEHLDNVQPPKKYKSSFTIKSGNISLKCSVPTVKRDMVVNESCIKLLDSVEPSEIDRRIGDVLIYELVKYVDSVTVGDRVISFDQVDIQSRVNVFEALPMDITSKMNDKLQEYNEIMEAILYSSQLPEGIPLKVDTRLFISE